MNHNQSHFAVNPVNIDIQRSKFKRPSRNITTFDAGLLIPIFVDEVLPGDTFNMDIANVVRMTTPIFPTMDNAFLDMEFFFVPNRLIWNHWKEFCGENNTTYWTQPTEYEIPEVKMPSGFKENSIADYMGIPTKVENTTVNSLPFKAYCLIWNEFWRDQNTMTPVYINKDDNDIEITDDPNNQIVNAQTGATKPLPVSKFHDYFTSCLPAPQKGEPVEIGLTGTAPVIGNGGGIGVRMTNDPNSIYQGDSYLYFLQSNFNTTNADQYTIGLAKKANVVNETNGIITNPTKQADLFTNYNSGAPNYVVPTLLQLSADPTNSGMVTDLSQATSFNINDIRKGFQIQKMLEKDSRGGTRYIEVLKAHFNVTSSDARLQRPEYLGGKRIPIQMSQVAQTSGTTNTSPQGNLAAFSHTSDMDGYFTKSFEEHGFVIGVCCVRTDQTYQQGLEKMWSRKRRYDFYWPSLANLGEVAVLNKELMLTNNESNNNEVFGYQEAWAEYRYKPNRVTGAMRSNYASGTLDSWHYANYFNDVPTLSKEFIEETDKNIKRTLAVQDEPQFFGDFYFDLECTRAMPMYSIPGLIDHH